MIQSLPLFHRIAGQTVIVLGEGAVAEAKRRLVERAGGTVSSDAEADARLAFVALDNPGPVAARLRARGLLVNVPDRPELCDFTLPSILDRSPVLIAIGTGGASAGLAKALRLRLETLLPDSLGALTRSLGEARQTMRARWPGEADRRRALDAALGPGGALDPMVSQSADRVAGWLADAADPRAGTVTEIHLTSSDPDDLTLRQLRLLGSAEVIAHAPDVPQAILALARADAARVVLDGADLPATLPPSAVILRI